MDLLPPPTIDEVPRLQELHALGLLDTPPEARFDVITQLATHSLDMPMALVSLVDGDRQWFKSTVGVELRETPRDVSFCSHALSEHEMLVVPDATQDPRFVDNALVTGPPHLCFYAGAVLHGPRGYPIGTLCVLDRRPRTFSPEDRARLLHLARLVEWEIRQDQVIARMLLEVEKDKLAYTFDAIPDRRTIYESLAATMARGESVAAALGRIEDDRGLTLGGVTLAAVQWELTRRLRLLPSTVHVGMWRQTQFLAYCTITDADAGTAELAKVLRSALDAQYHFDGEPVPIRTAIGISTFPADADAVRLLLQCAQAAAVAPAPAAFHIGVYAGSVAEGARRTAQLTKGLWEALSARRLRVEYQPIVETTTQALRSGEALLRWDDPTLGAISPAEFIPIAESSELIVALGSFVLKSVIAQLARWRSEQRVAVPIAVNVSSQQLRTPGFADLVIALVRGANVDPAWLTLEVTEHALIADLNAAAATLTQLHEAGIRCTVDDFGVGFSSLNYVRRLPVSTIKIDREFVDGIERDARAADIVGAIINMARTLGLKVIAEGVESEAQRQVLENLGCDAVQGFLISASERAEHFAARLEAATSVPGSPLESASPTGRGDR